MTSSPSTCPICEIVLKSSSLNSLRAHLARTHNANSKQAWHIFNGKLIPSCSQCQGPVKFLSFQSGYELLCGKCNKKNSQLRGALSRKKKQIPAWNKGLTEATSESVKKSAEGCRSFIKKNGHWRVGRTKENDPSIAAAALKISKAQRKRWADGTHSLIGKNASNHEGIKLRGEAISRAFLTSDRHWSHKEFSSDVMRRAIATRRKKIESGELSPFRLSQDEIDQRLKLIDSGWIVTSFTFSGYATPINVKCKSCDKEYEIPFNLLYKGKVCPTCYPSNFSKWHQEIYAYVGLLDSAATANDRQIISPKELDIVSSDKKFAIECNGLYWHSEACGARERDHQLKTDVALQSGTSLFHIFEDEWRDPTKREIVKSIISVKLGKVKTVMARKLSLTVGKGSDVSTFMKENHLDGDVLSSYSIYLSDNEGIAMALTLRKPHQQKKWGSETLELARVATRKMLVVAGGMSRLISTARKIAHSLGFKRLITYRDLRLGGSGSAYLNSNFVVNHITSPRFWWTDGTHRIDRFAVKAVKGIATQEEMALDHRLFKIWGCSSIVYVMDLV